MNIALFPSLNACLNGLSAILLLSGYIAIKKGHKDLHKKLMISALATSTIFLGCYLFYHYHAGSKKFPDIGLIRNIYLGILLTHTILAVVMLPFIFLTFMHAFKQNWVTHKKWARITFPIWFYVSLTGVVIYFMLYQWFKV